MKNKDRFYIHIETEKDLIDILKIELKNHNLSITEVTREFWRLLVNKSPYVDKILKIYIEEREGKILNNLEEKVYKKFKRKTYVDNKEERERERELDFKKLRTNRTSKVVDLDQLYDIMEKEKKEETKKIKNK
jgi:uncharacterized protein YjhX (UPF0386 family)